MLLTRLRALRRRARLVRVVTSMALTALVLAGVSPALLALTSSWTLASSLALFALAATTLMAWLRTPSLRAVAAAADRALSLEDRAVTALQHATDADAFSILVVRDAERRLQAADPASVFPFVVPRHARTLAIAAAIAAVAGLTIAPESLRPALPASSAQPEGDAAGASTDTAAKLAAAPAESVVPGAKTARRATAASEPRRGEPRQSDVSGQGATERPVAAPPSQAHSTTATTPPHGETAPGRGASRDLGRASISEGTLNARGSGGAAASKTPLAGGVSADAPLAPPAAASDRRTVVGGRASTAADRAEAAMARDDIPPALRSYVRAYFEAIRR